MEISNACTPLHNINQHNAILEMTLLDNCFLTVTYRFQYNHNSLLIIRKSINFTQLKKQECKKFPNTYSVYMVRLDTPSNALIENILTTFRLILKIMLIEFRTKF